MYSLTRLFLTCLIVFGVLNCTDSEINKSNDNLKLFYNKPAENWTDALPVGNGRLGAMVFGGIVNERIQLNEESLWAGTKINNNNPEALNHLKEIQRLLLKGENRKARHLADKYMLGTPPRLRSYQTLGDLVINFNLDSDSIYNYKRELNLSSGISNVSFTSAGVEYSREVFASSSENVIVIRLKSNEKSQLSFSTTLERMIDSKSIIVKPNSIIMNGQIIDKDRPERGPFGKHMKFSAKIKLIHNGGRLSTDDKNLIVENADDVTILVTAATDYNINNLNYDRSINPVKICDEIIEKASAIEITNLTNNHVNDHREIFDRVYFDLGEDSLNNIPTNKRLERMKEGYEDPGLLSLYFQYGRYLLMSSSTSPGVLPANLQGIWNEHIDAPWNSDYHTNINLQMNYWPAEVCNLPETVIPLSNFFTSLLKPGRTTAKEMYGSRGWMMHHATDLFGRTGLMDGVQWGTSPLAGAWMTLTFWRHYQFTQNEDYLRKMAYPIMKEASLFILDFLIEDGNGNLVTAPSISPENSFFNPKDNSKTQITYSATIDNQIITELFNSCIVAAKILDVDSDYVLQMKETLEKLPNVIIGEDETIREWIEDYVEVEPGHRHMSHLFGLHPGSQITTETPELFNAAKKTLEKRLANGGGHTGWSRAWVINFYARLLDGESAYVHLLELLKKSTFSNLFDNHPPFQIDGNFGGSAGIAELLLQSQNNVIHILPALPNAWQKGIIKGLKARGNFKVDIYWRKGELTKLVVQSSSGGVCNIRYKNNSFRIKTEKGKNYLLNKDLKLL